MLLALFTIAIGILCLWGARYWIRLRRRVNSWPTTPGRIVRRSVIQPTDRGRLSAPAFRWSPEARYTYRVDGADHEGDKIWLPWSGTGTREAAERFLTTLPDDVDVRYDPADPRASCLFPPPRSTAIWYAVAGCILLPFGLIWLLVEILTVV